MILEKASFFKQLCLSYIEDEPWLKWLALFACYIHSWNLEISCLAISCPLHVVPAVSGLKVELFPQPG